MKYLNNALITALYLTAATDDGTGSAAQSAPAPTKLTPAEQAELEAAKEALHTTIKANFNNKVDIKETNFHFRKVEDEKTGVTTKRPTVTLPVPVPSVEGIIAIIEAGGKGLDLLVEACANVIMEQAREYINDHEDVTDANFPYSTLSWDHIANLPKAERRGGGISKELWEEFAADYIAVMPGVTGKTKEQVTLAAKVFLTKFANAKTNKPVLKVLQGQLAMYLSNTTQAEQFAPCVEFLDNKMTTLLNTDETNLLLAL